VLCAGASQFISDVNRFAAIDSKLLLDASRGFAHAETMITHRFSVYIERSDPSLNMARYYAIEITASLLGASCLTRRWGRIGCLGQIRHEHFDRPIEAVVLFLRLLRQKRDRGYQTRRSDR
jgi:predicted DNA-binding WGR domain protein